jgi:type II secretory pathway component PulM
VKSLSPPVRRIIAVALLVVAIALPYRLIVQPLLEAYAEGSEEVDKQQEMLVRYRKLADSRADLQARL